MRFCYKCNDKLLCDECNDRVNENKEIQANINLSKRQPPQQFDHMLP